MILCFNLQDRIASMLMRHRASNELMLRFRISFKQWQLQWLSGRVSPQAIHPHNYLTSQAIPTIAYLPRMLLRGWLRVQLAALKEEKRHVVVKTQEDASHSTGRHLRQISNLEGELVGVKKSLQEATNALHRKSADEQSLRAQARHAASNANQSVDAMKAQRDLEGDRLQQLQDELQAQQRETQSAKNAAEAQRLALDRAALVHKEELRAMQEEIDQYRKVKGEWTGQLGLLERQVEDQRRLAREFEQRVRVLRHFSLIFASAVLTFCTEVLNSCSVHSERCGYHAVEHDGAASGEEGNGTLLHAAAVAQPPGAGA